MTKETANIAHLEMQVEINATVAKVWKGLTDNIGEWWPAEFYACADSGGREFKLEDWPGGRMIETTGKGGGVLWGTVIAIEPEVQLQVLGVQFPNWGGPSEWYGSWDLSASKTGTTLKFSESAVGRVSDAGIAEKDKGWQFLWNTLKAHVEGTPKPVWSD